MKNSLMYELANNAAHGVTQAFSEKSDVPYSAVMSALKSAESKMLDGNTQDEQADMTESDVETCHSVIAIPVVAITSPLYRCTIDDEGDAQISKIGWAALDFGYPVSKVTSLHKSSIVYIVTEEKLPAFFESIKNFSNDISMKLESLIPIEKGT